MNVIKTEPNEQVSAVAGWPKHAIPIKDSLFHDYPWNIKNGFDEKNAAFGEAFEPAMAMSSSVMKPLMSSSSVGSSCCCSG